jgi:hypothetical protein
VLKPHIPACRNQPPSSIAGGACLPPRQALSTSLVNRDLRFLPLDAMCELTAARTTVDCSNGIEVSQATVGRYMPAQSPLPNLA